MRGVYFNEFDAQAAEWLRELIREGLLPDGEVDERDIREVTAADLKGFTACHFFAGIGGWAHALRLAGWPDSVPVWTGSCPCQPYSSAGKGKGDADPRNLWPEFFRLIRECRPHVVFGEQVEGAIRHGWLDGVSADLEGEGYAVGAAVLGAHSVGAPHTRQRLYWVADSVDGGRPDTRPVEDPAGRARAGRSCRYGRMADATVSGTRQHGNGPDLRARKAGEDGERDSDARQLGDPVRSGRQGCGAGVRGGPVDSRDREPAAPPGDAGFWSAFDLIPCRDGKARRTQPGLFPLADGIPGRVGLLRGAGNAIVPQVAAAFIEAYREAKAG